MEEELVEGLQCLEGYIWVVLRSRAIVVEYPQWVMWPCSRYSAKVRGTDSRCSACASHKVKVTFTLISYFDDYSALTLTTRPLRSIARFLLNLNVVLV